MPLLNQYDFISLGFYRNATTDPLFLLKPGAIALAAGAGAYMAGKGSKYIDVLHNSIINVLKII